MIAAMAGKPAADNIRYANAVNGGAGSENPTVFVVDPDPATGQLVSSLVDGHQIAVRSLASARDFFAAYDSDLPGCLVSELRVFDASGRQIQRRLAEQNRQLPVVFVTSILDVATAVALMREGAVNVVEKPLRSVDLFHAIQEALHLSITQRQRAAAERKLQESICMLTCKERHFVGLLAESTSMKSIASKLSISSRAVEVRRRNVMVKLALRTTMELLRFALVAHERFEWLLSPPSPSTEG